MKQYLISLFSGILITITFLINVGCNGGLDVIDDTQSLVALRKVTVAYDSLTMEFEFPQGALTSGKTFAELLLANSVIYSNPENYSVIFNFNMTADNTSDGAKDAKFDGMDMDAIFNNIKSSPVKTASDPFSVSANTKKTIITHGEINLKTHRSVGLYIFTQVVAGDKIKTTLSPSLNYKIGSNEGNIDLPDINTEIPTRFSDETKAFLKGLLESGALDQ